jgi:nicotinamide-nucleotide amidase
MALEHVDLARRLGQRARQCNARIATAESCTGGLIAAICTAVPDSSEWFECAFVTYRLSAKRRLLHVSAETLSQFGAVSEATAMAMARGALGACDATDIAAVTGLAGPSGGSDATPVGTVWLAWAKRDSEVIATRKIHVSGNRDRVRSAAAEATLEGLIEHL